MTRNYTVRAFQDGDTLGECTMTQDQLLKYEACSNGDECVVLSQDLSLYVSNLLWSIIPDDDTSVYLEER